MKVSGAVPGLALKMPTVKASNSSRITQLDNKSNDTNSIVRNLVDSAIRATGRQAEATIETIAANPFIRLPFRFVTEVARNGTSASLNNVFHNKKVTGALWLSGAKKALENTTATAIFEPNRFENKFARMGAGFANMAVRFAARVGLMALEVIGPEEMSLEDAPDEFLSRSVGRVVNLATDNPAIGLASRFAEQVAINLGLQQLPIRRHLMKASHNEPQQEIPTLKAIA